MAVPMLSVCHMLNGLKLGQALETLKA